jgi:hypothetical protein
MVENDSFNGLAASNSIEAKSLLATGGGRWGRRCDFCRSYSMMQKVHSGVVVHSEGARVRIEGIDLKVW